MLELSYKKRVLKFKNPLQSPAGKLTEKDSWLLLVKNTQTGKCGLGECTFLPGLSLDDPANYEETLAWLKNNINQKENQIREKLRCFPSIVFGFEGALTDLQVENHCLFHSSFTKGLKPVLVNAIIWDDEPANMQKQLTTQVENGFKCIKIKIRPHTADQLLNFLSRQNKKLKDSSITFRLDANGKFKFEEISEIAKILSKLPVQAIEQPLAVDDLENTAKLCRDFPVAIALDEQLIGVFSDADKRNLLQHLNPQYIVIKPSLLGGFKESEKWIEVAKNKQISWWATSALESNIGLAAFSQWAFKFGENQVHGLATTDMFTNDFPSPLRLKSGKLWYDKSLILKKHLLKCF